MPSQSNSGLQYDKSHAITTTAQADIAPNRLIGYDGTYATSAGGTHDAQGVSEFPASSGCALGVVTRYSYLVECSAAIAFGDYIKPAADGSGRAAVGAIGDHCGRALGATTTAGQLFEMQIVQHVHA